MPSVIQNAELEKSLRAILERDGYILSQERMHGETGVEIIARKGTDEIHIEVIGYKASGPARAKDFYECFFRTVSRLKDGATTCVIALHSKQNADFRRVLVNTVRHGNVLAAPSPNSKSGLLILKQVAAR